MIRKIVTIAAVLFLPYGLVFGQGVVDNDSGHDIISGSDKLITLDLEGAQLLDVLKLLSRQTNINFVMSQNMQPHMLTLYLTKTPLNEAMDIIFRANNLGYDYYPDSNVFIVKELAARPVELVTRTYCLKYARIGNSSMSAERTNALGSGIGTSLYDAMNKALTQQGKLIEDSLSNSLIITDVVTQFPVIEQVLKSIDVPMPQIMIEVEMIDVAKRLVDELGARLGTQGGNLVTYGPGSRTSNFPWPNRLDGGKKGETTMGTLSLEGMDMALQLFSKDTTTKSLARPKIVTLANETAEVNLTIDEVIGVKKTEGDNGDKSYEAERATTGTRLRVTPQVNPETQEITLVLNVFNRESKDSGIAIEGNATKNVEERSTKSLVRLKNGETLLIGGLLKQAKEKSTTKIPYISDIPFMGKLFRYNVGDDQERELLVFLTPRIVKDEAVSILDRFAVEREQRDASKINTMRSVLDRVEKKVN